jgi:PIN domain nuclease of toxin-antitoxin system
MFGFGIFQAMNVCPKHCKMQFSMRIMNFGLVLSAFGELLLLTEKGRIILRPTPEQWIRDSLQQLQTNEAPLSNEIAVLSRQLKLEHQDPADRFIAATAIHLNLILATVDERLTKAFWLKTLS